MIYKNLKGLWDRSDKRYVLEEPANWAVFPFISCSFIFAVNFYFKKNKNL